MTHYARHRAYYIAKAHEQKVRDGQRIRDFIDGAKNRPCADCRIQYPPYVMDFDHLDARIKRFNLGSARSGHRWGLKKIAEEIAKCDVVCANCHRVRTQFRLHSVAA